MKEQHTLPERPIDIQVGGTHYKDMEMQPIELMAIAELDCFQGNVVKYIARHKTKNGKQDLEKAKHYCDLGTELLGLGVQYVAPARQLAAMHTFCRINKMQQYERLFAAVVSKRYHDASRMIQDLITMWNDTSEGGGQ